MRTLNVIDKLAGALLLGVCAMTVGCSENEGEPSPTAPPDDPYENTPSGDGAPEGLGLQSWGVGAKWYDYDGTIHAVSPTNEAWYFVRDDVVWHLSINQYYDREGTSGHPDMIVQRWDASSSKWVRVGRWEASAKVGTLNQCFTLENPSDSRSGDACNDFEYDVIWRADFRPLPSAGFSISNPGFYVATDRGGDVFNVQMKQPTTDLSLLESESAVRIKSIFDHDAVSIIEARFFTEAEGSEANTVISLTGDMNAAQWRAELDESSNTLVLEARCVAVNTTDPANAPTLEDLTKVAEINLDDQSVWTLVDLCGEEGPEVAYSLDEIRPGLWPSNNSFDLAIERRPNGIVLWMTPEQVMKANRGGAWDPITVPREFWD